MSPRLVRALPTTADALPTALHLEEVSRSFLAANGNVVQAVAGVTLSVHQGEVLAVIGPSGCGKSSILRILAGLDEHYDGRVEWNNAAADAGRTRLLSATVFQSDSTLPWMTVEHNVRLGLSGLKIDRAAADERVRRYLGLVGLSDFSGAYPHELSGGMRQRVAIARALAAEPLLLLMDEPLSALDAQTRLVMQQELIRIWRETRSTVVYVTHDISEAIALADRIVVLRARPGRIKEIRSVPFPRDRNVLELRRTKQFGEMEVDLWQMVAEEVGEKL
ncbi:MAG TPA: ABC transporter ATP-binding protein [Xanthobacteraceae bacterium]|jgi:ABC-type nitrate/sulfonate/bicarbonate transport system ATPase subunit|nr:ABC transporter ATP-binding protein [Xanthobacteraceae bacterium]